MSTRENFHSTYEGVTLLLERLRGPDGCPWDREQTHQSMKHMLLEECYELIDAIEQNDPRKMVEELGDVLFHVAFQARIAEEANEFSHRDVFGALIEKLVRRHPHVFAGADAADAEEVKTNWQTIKDEERAGSPDASALDGIPSAMPALAYANAVQERAARVGFDWDDYKGVLDKVAEELRELDQASSQREREAEMGDLLFSMVNAARWLGVDPEGALRQTNARFYRRFASMERLSRERRVTFSGLPLDGKEALWQEAKALEG